jgi:hypothetical protein
LSPLPSSSPTSAAHSTAARIKFPSGAGRLVRIVEKLVPKWTLPKSKTTWRENGARWVLRALGNYTMHARPM